MTKPSSSVLLHQIVLTASSAESMNHNYIYMYVCIDVCIDVSTKMYR